jgi:16S rRNA (guanine527-N7)-methyltransferase
MNSADAQRIMHDSLAVSRETLAQIEAFSAYVIAENEHQNLISRASEAQIWQRHLLDSAQLLRHLPAKGPWLDLGSGPGFPGIVLALMAPEPIILVESRSKRVSFLERMIADFSLSHVQVHGASLESLATMKVSGIVARAFAPLTKIFALAHRFAVDDTVWVLPKGRSAQHELDAVRSFWEGQFHIAPSLSDAEAGIFIGQRLRPLSQFRGAE